MTKSETNMVMGTHIKKSSSIEEATKVHIIWVGTGAEWGKALVIKK